MPQLNGGGGDDLGANDEMISFKDEGEQEEKISENVSAERDLDDVKSSLVNESESSSDSEVRDLRARTSSGHEEQNNAVLLKLPIFILPLSANGEAPPNQSRLRKLRQSERLL